MAMRSGDLVRIGINAQLLSFHEGYRQAGVSRYVAALLEYLPAVCKNDEFVAFTGAMEAYQARKAMPGVEWVTSNWSTRRPEARIFWEQTAGQMIGRRYRLDLLHSPVNVIPLAGQSPQVVTVHDIAFEHYPEQYPRAKAGYLQVMTRHSVRRANRVIAVSKATKCDLIELYGCPAEKVTVVPNGVGDEMCPCSPEAATVLRRRRGLPEHFFLFVGTLQPRKNLEGLLRAYALIAAEVDWPLVVIGASGWLDDPIERTIRQLGLGGRVRFTGYVEGEDLPYWYSAATALVLPSFYEGFGIPVLESMACGTPVITSNTSSLPEVAGDTGLLVDPSRPRSIAGAMLRLAGDPELRRKLSEKGRERAQAFSWRRTAEATRRIYAEILGE